MQAHHNLLAALGAAVAFIALPALGSSQNVEHGARVQQLVPVPEQLDVRQGESVSFQIRAVDGSGNALDPVLRIAGAGRGFDLDTETMTVTGVTGGTQGAIIAMVVLPAGAEGTPVRIMIPVVVTHPAVVRTEITVPHGHAYEGTAMELGVRAFHGDDTERAGAEATWSSSDPAVASVNRFGQLEAHRPGPVTVTARVEGVEASQEVEVRPFPATRLELTGGLPEARTGDVLAFTPLLTDDEGRQHPHVPVEWGYSYRAPGGEHPGATALIEDGRFLPEEPGRYTITAKAGPLVARRTVEVSPRHVVQAVELKGQGRVSEVHTSDFWVFEGNDGRDYAISGTWGADGWAYMWDVTDRTNLVKTDSIQVDARTVNDVKVSPGARYATMTREGASNRRNGLVILDLADPAHPRIASVVDEGLTGGVHNAFPMEDHVYALSAGEKYVIIDVEDIYNPRVVSEVQHGNCRIHDVWVLDGLAFSAQWACGIIVYDVGNGAWGGTPENPVFVSELATPGGRTHAVFPYYQASTGKFLVFAGDEIMSRQGMALGGGSDFRPYDPETGEGGVPSHTAGYVHILDFTEMESPLKIARYKVPEYGTHNIWVEDDVLYQAYYEGGLRVVDVSGELMGNLHTQGREMAVFKPYDPIGFISNAPMVWSGMPFKGEVFLSDFNSGMWSLRLEPRQPVALE
jgi:hypothetical protein